MDLILRVLYWLAVLAISLALLVGLVLFLESRDPSAVSSSALEGVRGAHLGVETAISRANTTIRFSAE